MVVKASDADVEHLKSQQGLIESMGTAKLAAASDAQKPAESSAVLTGSLEICVCLSGLVDFEAERARLTKERVKIDADVVKLTKKLSNEGFLAKAAAEIIEKDRNKLAELSDKLARIDEQLKSL